MTHMPTDPEVAPAPTHTSEGGLLAVGVPAAALTEELGLDGGGAVRLGTQLHRLRGPLFDIWALVRREQNVRAVDEWAAHNNVENVRDALGWFKEAGLIVDLPLLESERTRAFEASHRILPLAEAHGRSPDDPHLLRLTAGDMAVDIDLSLYLLLFFSDGYRSIAEAMSEIVGALGADGSVIRARVRETLPQLCRRRFLLVDELGGATRSPDEHRGARGS